MQSPLLTFHNNQLFKLLLKLEYVEETKNAHKLLLWDYMLTFSDVTKDYRFLHEMQRLSEATTR